MTLQFLSRVRAKISGGEAKNRQTLRVAAAQAMQDKRFEAAIHLYDSLIDCDGGNVEAFYKRANAHNALRRWAVALADYDRAIELDPAHAFAHCNRGSVLEKLGRWDEALASYERAIELDPEDSIAYYNRGSVLRELGRFDEALGSYDRAIEINKVYTAAFVNRGNVLHKLRRYEAAIASYDRAIELDAAVAEAHQGRGISMLSLRRFQEALASYDRAILVNSDYVEAYSNRGSLLQELGQHEAALASFNASIERNPAFAPAHQGKGFSLLRLQRFVAAIQSFDAAINLDAGRRYLPGMRLYAKMQVCDWNNVASEVKSLIAGVQANQPVSVPLPVLALTDSPALHRSVAMSWVRDECEAADTLGPIPKSTPGEKIRVGYFSSDFCEHAVSLVTAQLFELHDRARFEITAFAFGPRPQDKMRARLQAAFDRFVDVRDRSDTEIATLARSLGIDIAVDLNGHTEFSRANIFALRAAPIQVNYLGYPGTLGAAYMDYLIADRIVVPEAQQRHYTEKVIYLPHTFLPHDTTRAVAPREFTRPALGLPEVGFVFCCFNNNYKITPEVFSSWMRILNRTDGSVLWLPQNDPATAQNLRREAQSRGVKAERLVFFSRMDSLAEHLARMRVADLFLDTHPYNAHATAADALWAGVPLLTRRGESFASSVAASALTAVGLPELIALSEQEYEDTAVKLAETPRQLEALKAKLHRNRGLAPLFDTPSFTTHLESAYVMVLERYHAGLPPDHIYVNT